MTACTERSSAFRWGLMLVLVVFGAGCQFDPYTFSYAKAKPDVRDIVGSWKATHSTLQNLVGTRYASAHPTIAVLRDGSIEMTDIPDTWRALDGRGSGHLEAFAGSWELVKHQHSWWGLTLRRGDWGCDGCLMIIGQRAPYKLVIRFGDPDEGSGYEFEKAG